jgi:hypothetical protein
MPGTTLLSMGDVQLSKLSPSDPDFPSYWQLTLTMPVWNGGSPTSRTFYWVRRCGTTPVGTFSWWKTTGEPYVGSVPDIEVEV